MAPTPLDASIPTVQTVVVPLPPAQSQEDLDKAIELSDARQDLNSTTQRAAYMRFQRKFQNKKNA